MIELAVCHESGYRAGPDCENIDTMEVPVNGAKVKICPFHFKVHLNKEQTFQVNSSCYPVAEMVEKKWFVLPPAMAWYFKKQNPHYHDLPPMDPACRTGYGKVMELIYPKETKQVFIPRNLDGTLSSLVFEVAHSIPGTAIYWHLDDEYLGETSRFHQMELRPDPGWHTLVLIDASGNILEKRFEVVDAGR
jgi:penicillin-binding protein 1C